eukprot:GHVN01031624.1.p1 GENE.GHVN01031624.1~~GHVN01031624.1.p1  ORF type:complete len:792 (+),score=128.76 GHVN01031624.1:58-2376(+)
MIQNAKARTPTADADVLKGRLEAVMLESERGEKFAKQGTADGNPRFMVGKRANDEKESLVDDRRNSGAGTEISGPMPSPGLCPTLLVIKVGTSSLMDPQYHTVSLSHLGRFVDTVCNLKRMGYHVVIVSSGAVGLGCVHLKLAERPKDLANKQAVAAVGQCRLMRIYEDLFSIRESITAQVLITRTDLVDRTRFLNFKRSLLELLAMGVTPIINENDSVATEFLRFGDNDTLAAYCAVSISANWLILLTDVHCLYTTNPRTDPKAKAIAFVERVSEAEKLLDTRTNAGTAWGSGGMETKIVSAKIATAAGIHTALAHGQYPERILDILHFAETNSGEDEAAMNRQPEREGVYPSRSLKKGNFFSDSRFAASSAAVSAAAAAGDTSSIDTFYNTINQQHGSHQQGQSDQSLQPGSTPLVAGLHPSPSRADLIQTAADELYTTQHQLEQQLEIVQQIEAELDSTVPSTTAGTGATSELHAIEMSNKKAQSSVADGSNTNQQSSTDGDGEDEHEELTNATLAARGILAVDPVGSWQEKLPYVGTIFVGQDCTQSIRDQRRWILSLPVRGKLYVDEGCCTAVILEKKSLFAAGIKVCEGEFIEGDVVAICRYKDIMPASLDGGASSSRHGTNDSGGANPLPNPVVNINQPEKEPTGMDQGAPSRSYEERSASSSPITASRHQLAHPLHNQTDLIVQAATGTISVADVVGVNTCPNELARCIVNFPSIELEKIKGLRSAEFRSVLGYDCDPEVAHRSNIIFVDTSVYMEDEEAIASQ